MPALSAVTTGARTIHRGRWSVLAWRSVRVRELSLPSHRVAACILVSAAWGILVDASVLPVLAPTENSTLVQASTAAPFALIGIFFGPLAGALGGLCRDGSIYLISAAAHPELINRVHVLPALGRAAVDIIEDVVLGFIPGLVAIRTRRFIPLVAASGLAAWVSLPFLVVCDAWIDHERVLRALTTIKGNWDQPVDPGLAVYALFTAGLVALALAAPASRPYRAAALGVALMLAGFVLIGLGAHS